MSRSILHYFTQSYSTKIYSSNLKTTKSFLDNFFYNNVIHVIDAIITVHPCFAPLLCTGKHYGSSFQIRQKQTWWQFESVWHQPSKRHPRIWYVFLVAVHPCHDWLRHDFSDFGVGKKSARRYGLPCTTVCGLCQLEEYDNPHNKFLPEESDDEDEQWLSVYYNVLMGWKTWFIWLLDHNLCHSFQTSYLGTFDDFLGARNLDTAILSSRQPSWRPSW